MSKYETSAGAVTRSHTIHKLLDLLAQLIDLAKIAQDPDRPTSATYTRMITTCDSIIDQSAVIAHLHKTETSAKDIALGDGWLSISHTFQITRNVLTALTKAHAEPQAWRDVTTQLEHIKWKLTQLGKRTLS